MMNVCVFLYIMPLKWSEFNVMQCDVHVYCMCSALTLLLNCACMLETLENTETNKIKQIGNKYLDIIYLDLDLDTAFRYSIHNILPVYISTSCLHT